ncbi:sodium-dependent transporter [Nanoarchaeota archaeon]
MARDRWGSRTIFLFAAIGSAVGLGNVWRFPYLTHKFGGGAFLIPYLIALLVMGIPLLILEFALGQKIQQGAIGSLKAIHGKLGGIGFLGVITAFLIVCYYAVVMAWSLIYLFASFGVKWAADSKAYFFNDVLQISDSVGQVGGINWTIFGALAAVWVMIYFCIWKGPKSVGKVIWFTVPLPIILLGVLFIRVVTLPGFLTGWATYLRPDWTALLYSDVWIAAISQIFFTLSVAFGIMIAYGSYKRENEDIAKNTYVVALTNCAISLFAGFVVFGVLGYMATKAGTSVTDVVASGPGLAFVVFPQALSLMPWAAFFSVVFFLTLLTLGIDSAFSIVEGVNVVISDSKKKWKKQKIAFLVCFFAFLIGILFTTRAGLYFLDIIDHFLMSFNLVIVGVLECIAVGWIFGANKLRRYINSVSDWKVGRWWNVAIKYVIPLALIVFLVLNFWQEIHVPYEGYPMWALGIGWGVVIVPIVIMVGMMVGSTKK